MSKVQSKKLKDDLAQNTAVLQGFKKKVMDKLSPQAKQVKEDRDQESSDIIMRSFDPQQHLDNEDGGKKKR